MKHLIFGSGLIGSHLAGGLMAQGVDVQLIGREKSQAALANGFSVSNYEGEERSVSAPRFLDSIMPQADNFDVIWLTVKCVSLDALIPKLSELCGEKSTIICCQNGLGSSTIIKSAFPDNRILTALIGYNVAQPETNHFHQSTEGMFLLEESPISQEIVSAAASIILPISISEDIVASQWAKLQLNLTNPVNALADIPTKSMLEDRGFRKIIAGLMTELLSVVETKKIDLPTITTLPPRWFPRMLKLPNWLFLRVAQKMVGVDPTARLSMWWDLSAGRKTEIDFLNGALVREAEQLGVDCPLNRKITQLIHSVESGQEKIGITADILNKKLLDHA